MIALKLDIPPEIEDLMDGFSDEDMRDILLDAADGFCGPGGVLERHWERGQTIWGDPDAEYMRRKGTQEKFVKTGEARKALTGKSPYRVIQASKKGGTHRVEVALVRMEGGRNVYSIAQAGGRNNSGPPMRITDNLPGDEDIIRPHVVASIKRALKRKGFD